MGMLEVCVWEGVCMTLRHMCVPGSCVCGIMYVWQVMYMWGNMCGTCMGAEACVGGGIMFV